jgi:hypothetical protein
MHKKHTVKKSDVSIFSATEKFASWDGMTLGGLV